MTIGFRPQFRFANQLQRSSFSSKDSSIFLSIFMAGNRGHGTSLHTIARISFQECSRARGR
jgi:hypothetical protein